MNDEVVLEKVKFGIMQAISPHCIDPQIDIDRNYINDNLLVYIRSFVWGEAEKLKHQEITYPMDWIQAFKERWYPDWLLEKYPVIYKKVVLDVQAIYPEYKPAIPDQQYRLIIQRFDSLSETV